MLLVARVQEAQLIQKLFDFQKIKFIKSYSICLAFCQFIFLTNKWGGKLLAESVDHRRVSEEQFFTLIFKSTLTLITLNLYF